MINISNSYTPPENLSAKNFTIAFMLSNFYGEGSFDDPYYGHLELQQFEIFIRQNKTDGTTYREFTNYDIPFSKCKLGQNFFYHHEEEIKDYGLQDFYCPDWNNLTI